MAEILTCSEGKELATIKIPQSTLKRIRMVATGQIDAVVSLVGLAKTIDIYNPEPIKRGDWVVFCDGDDDDDEDEPEELVLLSTTLLLVTVYIDGNGRTVLIARHGSKGLQVVGRPIDDHFATLLEGYLGADHFECERVI